MKSKLKVSKIAKDLLMNHPDFNHLESVAYGDLSLLGEIFERSDLKVKIAHPMNRNAAVMSALDHESKADNAIFDKQYFRAYKGLARVFYLKDEHLEEWKNNKNNGVFR